MNIEAVLVCSTGDTTEQQCRSSGILLNERFVLTTGTILISHLQDPQRSSLVSACLKPGLGLVIRDSFHRVKFNVWREAKCGSAESQDRRMQVVQGTLAASWKCPLVAESMEGVMHDWTVNHGRGTYDSSSHDDGDILTSKELVSVFVLIKCDGSTDDDLTSILKSMRRCAGKPVRGDDVEVVSTPFGNENFFNSLSRGIVGNVVGVDKCLSLNDARTVPGCQGAPIFSVNRSRKREKTLIGLVTCPLTWWRGEWVGLTVGINLVPVLDRLLGSRDKVEESRERTCNLDSGLNLTLLAEELDDVVVLVRCGRSWASGVVLDSRTVITCSHVVYSNKGITVSHGRNRHPAIVVYKTPDDVPYDLAIVQTKEPTFKKFIKFSDKTPKIGDSVVAAGFPLFSEEDDVDDLRPTIVRGCLSFVSPHMIQTTCCIQSGFSGGALLQNGKLLGIIVSNARDTSSGALFPHVNFIVPCSAFADSVLAYLKTKDVRFLKNLTSNAPSVTSIWSLKSSKL